MNIISDKEIGELWLRDGWDVASPVRELILKLVEERNCRRMGCTNFDEHTHPFGLRPICDFGIPEESWK